jgi:hypothetical protein
MGGQSPIGDIGRAGDEGGVILGQEKDHVGNFLTSRSLLQKSLKGRRGHDPLPFA